MDLNFTAEQIAFRDEVRAFLKQSLSARLSEKVRTGKRLLKADYQEWHAILSAKGWLATHWPAEWGGSGWDVFQRHIFEVEAALSYAPPVVQFGVGMLGPVLIKYGSEEQKRHWLPRILDGSDWWCQGYSEPGSGSDLASLKCSATFDGGEYIVNGQKTWTTLAQHANMIFCLVRTDTNVKKQEGISFLLIDMRSPGVDVRPIKLLDGECEVNEVFFTDVRVPRANLVGEENKGWTYAKYLLTYERSSLANIGRSMAAFNSLLAIVASQKDGRRSLNENPYFATRLAKIRIELENMKTTNLRVLAAVAGGGAPVAESSMLKIRGTEILQEITSLTRRALGKNARPYISAALDEGYNGFTPGPENAAASAVEYFNNRKQSIYGGSNEIQREIMSKAILGL